MANSLQLTLLIVDDDASVRRSLARMLQAHGYRVIAAANGTEAVRLALAESPAAIVVDLAMPGQSGVETIKNIRAQASLAGVGAIALTASPVVPDEAAALFQQVLHKPCSAAQLLAAIRAVAKI